MTAEKTTASDAYGIKEQKTRTFRYDAVNRLSEVLENGKCLQKNVYDAEGLRSEMEENDRLVKFLYDGDKVIAERDDTKGLKRYIRGYELVSSDCEQARTYYHYASDELGSITDVLNYKGEVLNHYEYDAFGEFSVREEQVENRFAFAGEQFDPATNLYYLRARFYNPVIGRFIQEDTYYGDGLNLYAYCHNNPVGYVDPSGHNACPAHEAAVAELQKKGMSPEQAEKAYRKLREQGYTPEQIKNGDYKSGSGSKFTNGSEVVPKYSTLEQRYAVIPSENGTTGYWTGKRRESMYVSSDPRVKSILDAHNQKGVNYKNGMPDFSPFVKHEFKIDMSNDRNKNFAQANRQLAEKLSAETGQKWTSKKVTNWMCCPAN